MAILFVSIASFVLDTDEAIPPAEPTFIENKITGAMVRTGSFFKFIDPASKACELMMYDTQNIIKPSTDVFIKFSDLDIKVK